MILIASSANVYYHNSAPMELNDAGKMYPVATNHLDLGTEKVQFSPRVASQ